MKFGVCIPHYGIPLDVDNLTNMAIKAEEMGFDSVWVTDHIIVPHEFPDRTDIVYRHDMLEPVSLLTYLGAVTSRINIGTSVIILPYRNPVVLAKAIATADVLSKGRVIYGAAIGWMEGEFKVLNAPIANRGEVSEEYIRGRVFSIFGCYIFPHAGTETSSTHLGRREKPSGRAPRCPLR